MLKILNNSNPIVLGLAVGIAFGLLDGMGSSGVPPHVARISIEVIVPFGLIFPPLLIWIQRSTFKNQKPAWFFKIHAKVNLLFLVAFYALSSVLTIYILHGEIYSFFAASGVGFLIAALIEMRW